MAVVDRSIRDRLLVVCSEADGALRSRWRGNESFDDLLHCVDSGAVLLLPAFHLFHLRARSLCVARTSRSLTKARMIRMFMCTARLLLSTEESIATPCSVNA